MINNIFLPESFQKYFSEEEKLLTWTWESGHNPMPVTPLSQDIQKLTTEIGASKANEYFGRSNKSLKKIINGYTYYATSNKTTSKNNLNDSYSENLNQKWNDDFLPEILKDLDTMKSKLNLIEDINSSLKIIDELITIHQRHWNIHMQIVIPLHDYTDDFFQFIKSFNADYKLSNLYDLFKGIKNKTVELDENLYKLKKLYDSLANTNSDEKILIGIEKFNEKYGYRAVGFDLADDIWKDNKNIVLNILKSLPLSVFENKISELSRMGNEDRLINDVLSFITGENNKNKFHNMYLTLRSIWNLKEDHSFYIDQYSSALISLAFRKLGTILVEQKYIQQNTDIFHLNYETIKSLNSDTLVNDILQSINENKTSIEYHKNSTPPKFLGLIPSTHIEGNSNEFSERLKQLKGTPASNGKITGVAKIIKKFEDSSKLEQGDIMVCISTNPSWTPLFGIVSGIICENGGTLSHTAIVAREYEIPTILDANNAPNIIKDNDIIEINGDTGVISFLN